MPALRIEKENRMVAQAKRRASFDADWKFIKGDVPGAEDRTSTMPGGAP